MRKKLFKSIVDLGLGFGSQHFLTLLRNIVIARIIGPEEFGITVTFAIVVSILEVISDVGVEQYLVRSPDGDDPKMQSTLHSFIFLRGLLIGLSLYLLADDFARLFGISDIAWAYEWLALVPVIKGLAHLDVRRFHRKMRYRPGLIVELFALCVSFAAAVLLAYNLRSYQAVLWAVLIQVSIVTIGSHIVAERPFRLRFEKNYLGSLIQFGWPLMLNGVLLFAAGQGDRAIIGAYLGVAELANYAIVVVVTAGATLLVTKITGALYVPYMSAAHDNPTTQARRANVCGVITTFAAYMMVSGIVVLGPPVIKLLYGAKYTPEPLVIAWLGMVSGMTILKSWSIAVFLSRGITLNILYGNLIRFSGPVLSLIALINGMGPIGVAVSMAIGETLAASYSLRVIDIYEPPRQSAGWKLYWISLVVFLIQVLPTYAGWYSDQLVIRILIALAFFGLSLISVMILVKDFREVARAGWVDFRKRI